MLISICARAGCGPAFALLLLCSPAFACPDLDADGVVGSADLNVLLASFNAGCAGDLDGDGDTDSLDLNILLAGFGAACAPSGPPPNDRCCGAEPIEIGAEAVVHLDGALPDDGVACAAPVPAPGVWFVLLGDGTELTASVAGDPTGVTVSILGGGSPDACAAPCCIGTSAAGGFGLPSTCCTPQAEPGCDDPACEAAVCAQEPFCCDVVWDAACAAKASEICVLCGGEPSAQVTWCSVDGAVYFVHVSGWSPDPLPLSVTTSGDPCAAIGFGCAACFSNSLVEEEPCGASVNDTCADAVPLGGPGAVCGRIWTDGAAADSDWYRLELDEPVFFTIKVKAEFAYEAALFDVSGCTPTPIDADAGPACDSTFFDQQFQPGSYALEIRPAAGAAPGCPTACASDSAYSIVIFVPF